MAGTSPAMTIGIGVALGDRRQCDQRSEPYFAGATSE